MPHVVCRSVMSTAFEPVGRTILTIPQSSRPSLCHECHSQKTGYGRVGGRAGNVLRHAQTQSRAMPNRIYKRNEKNGTGLYPYSGAKQQNAVASATQPAIQHPSRTTPLKSLISRMRNVTGNQFVRFTVRFFASKMKVPRGSMPGSASYSFTSKTNLVSVSHRRGLKSRCPLS